MKAEILKSRYAAVNFKKQTEEALFGHSADQRLREFHKTLPEKIRPPLAPQFSGLRHFAQHFREEGDVR